MGVGRGFEVRVTVTVGRGAGCMVGWGPGLGDRCGDAGGCLTGVGVGRLTDGWVTVDVSAGDGCRKSGQESSRRTMFVLADLGTVASTAQNWTSRCA